MTFALISHPTGNSPTISMLPLRKMICPGLRPNTLAALVGLTWSSSGQEPSEAEPPVPTTDLVAQWLQTERLLSQEAEDWKAEQEHTNQLLELYRKELTLLDQELAAAGKNAGLIDKEAETLKEKIAASETARRKAITFLNVLKPRLLVLAQKFPAPLKDSIEEQTLGLKNEVTNKNAAEALRSVVKILQEASRFNRTFTFNEELIELGGETYTAKVMYFGLSRAYFLAGQKAGLATPGQDGWTFVERNELAPELTKAFAIHAKEIPSGFFTVPLKK